GDLADQLLDQVLQGHDSRGTPVFVDHDGQVPALLAHLRQRWQHPHAGGQPLDLAGQLPHGDRAVRVRPDEQVAQVHEADYVVVRAVDHREPGVPGGADGGGGPVDRQAGVEEHDIRARHHDLADVARAGGEYLVDDLPFLTGQHDVGGDEVAQFGLGDGFPPGGGAGAQCPGDPAGQ